MPSKAKTLITIRLAPATIADLGAIAKRKKESRSNVIRIAIEHYILGQRKSRAFRK